MAIGLSPGTPTQNAPVATKVKEVAFIVDKSGSMDSCRQQVISGYNEFVGDLKREKDLDIRFSLTLFDTIVHVMFHSHTVTDVRDMDAAAYAPDGWTALYDALGLTLSALEARLGSDKDTPVVVIVMTDGQENSSREFNRDKIKAKIEALQKRGNWTFVFMGADQDAWAAGGAIGIPRANTLSYGKAVTGQSIGQTSQATTTLLRSGNKSSDSFYKK